MKTLCVFAIALACVLGLATSQFLGTAGFGQTSSFGAGNGGFLMLFFFLFFFLILIGGNNNSTPTINIVNATDASSG